MKENDIKVTVFIPTYNGEQYLPEIFRTVFTQKVNFDYEVLVIDSGSSDSTLTIVTQCQKDHPNLRLHKIPNTEFGHGKTRNLAAQLARGEYVVYITHDAIPAHDRWLYEITRPFEVNKNIVGVMGKQIPRPNCIPMLKSEIRAVFGGFGPDFGTTLFYKDDFIQDQGTYDAVSFYSDANSAARKQYLTDQVPYKDVSYAEDQLFGRDIIDAGYYKAYAPRASVIHSNDLTLKEYRRRMFDETLGLRKIGLTVAVPSYRTVAKLITRGIARDVRNIARDKEYSFRRKIYWQIVNPLFHVQRWRGVRKGARVDVNDTGIIAKYSLEDNRKNNS